ncbi:MAG TPA: isochorismatase family protein [Solirubrobacteraceae bacterium]|nr:isochorismatase family protein [Solirubrobacteraceae bacterium]
MAPEISAGLRGNHDGVDAFDPGDAVVVVNVLNDFGHDDGERLLESMQIARIVLLGAATEGCVVQTAIDARELGLKDSIVVDACATTDPHLEETALRYAEDVGGVRLEGLGVSRGVPAESEEA